MMIADTLTGAESAALAALPTRRETQATKRAALVERDGHLDPCSDSGPMFEIRSV